MPKPYLANDKYAQKARLENYRARSVYKLQELDDKFHLIKPGMFILDIAAAPGSWMQYASKKVGSAGHVLGIDIQKIEPIADNTTTKIVDMYDINAVKNTLRSIGWDKADLILSDIAASTTGIAEVDHGRSIDLNTNIFELSKVFLKPHGKLVMKVFEGNSFQNFIKTLKQHFKRVNVTKPQASRDRSFEVYVICE